MNGVFALDPIVVERFSRPLNGTYVTHTFIHQSSPLSIL